MGKLRALLIDDEIDALNLLESLLIETEKIEVIQKISNSLQAESSVILHKPDVLFLDIKMPDYDGLKLLENIRKYNPELAVVYVTAHNNHGIDALKLNAFDYLLKPIDRYELQLAIDKLVHINEQKRKTTDCKIKLPVKDGYIYINKNQILYLKAHGNYTEINLVSGEKYISSYNMGRLYKRLGEIEFKRINRNLIASSKHLIKINKIKKTGILKSENIEVELPVSNTFIKKLHQI